MNLLLFDEKKIISIAGAHGHLNIVKWAIAKGFPYGWYSWTSASLRGKLEVLKWAKDNDPGFCAAECLFQTPINNETDEAIEWLEEVRNAELARV